MKKGISLFGIFLAVGILVPSFMSAAWSGSPYSQGETLNPECAPTEENCTVSILEPGNLFSLDGITYIGTLADTIDSPNSLTIRTVPDNSGYEQPNPGYPHTHSYRVYSYRNEGEGRVYSQTYTQKYLTIASNDVNGSYNVTISWDAVSGADGYRVFGSNPVPYDEYSLGTSFQYYQDIEGTELTDTSSIEDWSEGSDVFPNGIPFAVSEALGTVGIGTLPSENYALSVSGDTLTNGSIIFGNPNNNTAGIHFGPTGLYGQAQNWAPNPNGMNGLWIEGSNGEEGGGFFADGDMAAIWSAGDVDLLRIYDEDTLSTNRAAIVFDRRGFLRSDQGLVGVNDSMAVNGVLSVGLLHNENETEDDLGIQNQAMVNVVQPSNTPVEKLVGGDFENYNWYWQHSSSWSIDSGAYFTFNSEDTSRTIEQLYDDQQTHPIEGDLYDVSIDVGGDTGSVSVCLGQRGSDTGCEVVNAGAGTTLLTLAWHPDGFENDDDNTIISIQATENFNGYIDNISVMNREKSGLAFISSVDPVAVSIGLDVGEITDATGFKITIGDPGSTKSASFFLGGEDDSHYGYVLPNLGGENTVDTICVHNLGNCSGDSAWNSNEAGINFTDGNVGIGTNNPGATLEISGDGSGEFAGDFPSLLNIHTTNENPWGITFQNDEAGTDNEMGVFLDNNGSLIFGSDEENTALSFGQDGKVAVGTRDFSGAGLTIQQKETDSSEQITNGSFDGDADAWTLGGGWTYGDGNMSFAAPNPTGTIQSLEDVTIVDAGSGYSAGDTIGLNGGNNDVAIQILAVAGIPNSFTVALPGSGYQVNDVLTIDNGSGDSGSVQVDAVDGDGAVTAVSLITAGTNYFTDVNYGVTGGNGSGARFVPANDLTGVIRSLNVLLDGGTDYSSDTYSVTGGTGSGAIFGITISSYGILSQEGVLVDGDTYDVSLGVGGDTGTVQVCLDDGDCDTFDAGEGSVSFSGIWSEDFGDILRIHPSSDFNGTIDNVSVMSRNVKHAGVTILDSGSPMSVSIGTDVGDIAPAAGIRFDMDYGGGDTNAATFFLAGEIDSHYGYILPSLTTLGGPTSTDTFCMQNLGNCSSAVQSLSTDERDALESINNQQVIFNTDTKTMQYYTVADDFTLDTTGGGSAAHANQAMGQTFTPTETGVLGSITGSFAARPYNEETDGMKSNVVAKIYDEPNGTVLATSDNAVLDSDTTELTFVEGTWTFDDANLNLEDGTSYYIEFSDTDSLKNSLYFYEAGGNTYAAGAAYGGSPEDVEPLTENYDLYFILSYGASSGVWTDVSNGASSQPWNLNDDGINYMNGKVGVGTSSPHAGIDVVGGGTGIGFSQVAWYNDVNTWTMDVVVSGDKLYAADGAHLDIFDISDPEDETILTHYDFSQHEASPNTIRVVGNIAYVGAGYNVYVLDVSYSSQGQTPVLLGSFEGWNTVRDLQIKNGILYVIDSSYDFYTLDVSDITTNNPGTPQLLTDGAYETYNSPQKFAISGDYAYISESGDVLEVIDISNPSSPQYVTDYNVGSDSFDGGIAVKDDYVYATRYTSGGEGSFVAIDVSDPENPVIVGSANIGGGRYNTRVIISGNIAYVADGDLDSIYAINISYPANPIVIGYGTTQGNSYAVAPYKDKLFVADGAYGIVVLSAPINYSALFNGGNVGIGTNDPAFNLDVGAVKATATLTISNAVDADGFALYDGVDWWPFEFDDNESASTIPINILDAEDNPLTLTKVIDMTVAVINDQSPFLATRNGNTISIEQNTAGAAGNQWNEVFNDVADPEVHPIHTSPNIILTDFTGGANGDINFGGNLYQHGQLFTGSQWSDTETGISFTTGDVIMSGGDVSIGEGSFLYDNTTGITSIDNLSLGALTFPEDAGAVSWIDMPISGNATNGTIESYTASIGGLSMITIHGEMDGGDLVNTGIRLENLPSLGMGMAGYLCVDGDGEIITGDTACDVSSARFKENVNALTDDSGLAEVMKLNPVSFFYKPEFNGALQTNANFNGEQLGFIAEEVNGVDPRLAVLEKDGTTVLGVRYEKITAILVKAVKEIGGWINHFTTRKLCVGDTCVTENEFKALLQNANVTPVPKDDVVSPAEEPKITSEEENTPVPQNEEPQIENQNLPVENEIPVPEEVSPPAENPPAPEIVPTPELEQTPEVTPEPQPESTPEVDQTPTSDPTI